MSEKNHAWAKMCQSFWIYWVLEVYRIIRVMYLVLQSKCCMHMKIWTTTTFAFFQEQLISTCILNNATFSITVWFLMIKGWIQIFQGNTPCQWLECYKHDILTYHFKIHTVLSIQTCHLTISRVLILVYQKLPFLPQS